LKEIQGYYQQNDNNSTEYDDPINLSSLTELGNNDIKERYDLRKQPLLNLCR
jgi:hypothetical protein